MGTAVSKEEHQQLLEIMKGFDNLKTRTYLPANTTYEQIMEELETSDEVVLKLQDGTVLKVCKNFKFYVNGIPYGLNPTDTETASQYMVDYDTKKWVDVKPNWVFPEPRKALRTVAVYTTIPISNSYTGKQQFEKMLKEIIKNEHIFGGENI